MPCSTPRPKSSDTSSERTCPLPHVHVHSSLFSFHPPTHNLTLTFPVAQLPHRRLSHFNSTSRRRYGRRRVHHVRPQIGHAALRPRGPHPPPNCMHVLPRRPTAGDHLARRGRGQSMEGRREFRERVVASWAAAETGRDGVAAVQDVSIQCWGGG